jgi:hypothetical protein
MVWEHMVVEFNTNKRELMGTRLAQFGSVGWEVAGVSLVDKTIGFNSVMVILKRQRATFKAPDDRSAGWKPDPWNRFTFRWWNGDGWEEHVNDGVGSKIGHDWPFGAPKD